MDEVAELFRTVVDGGYCIGCGSCAAFAASSIAIELDNYGRFQATRTSNSDSDSALPVLQVCPFSDKVRNEDQLGQNLFPNSKYHPSVGHYLSCYVGHVNDPDIRKGGSSGGMGTWVLVELLRRGLIDGVVHVGAAHDHDDDSLPFGYRISRTVEQIRQRSKSRYYPVEMSQVLARLRNETGRFAIVGVPCFVKAVRLLCEHDPELNARIVHTIALFCGHLKSARFADFFGWQCGIAPGDLTSVNFRTKLPDRPASNYGITVKGDRNSDTYTECRPNNEYHGSSWGYGFFKYHACEYCDDVVGETADVSVGDAWLPGYVDDSGGTNVVVVRNAVVHELINSAIASGRLALTEENATTIAQSQDAGLRHRREGLSYRLYVADCANKWRPPTRQKPDADHLSAKKKRVYELRTEIARQSHTAFQQAKEQGSFDVFAHAMQPLLAEYDSLYKRSRIELLINRFRSLPGRVKRLVLRCFFKG
ncbi:MAG: Coenzyme F420 hydrogenase/dehydrogenase, beta subunit C-terminal domain [Planctomyces sp.]|jgi:coenzyme F420 hydrogenase subunit beta